MKKPHESVCTSLATKNRLIASLQKYSEYLESKRNDVAYTDQIERISKEFKENKMKGELQNHTAEGNEKLQHKRNNEKPKKIRSHIFRLIRNMETLRKLLKEMPRSQEDVCHIKSHRNFERKMAFVPKKGPLGLDEERIYKLAKPKKTKLKTTLECYRKLMSAERQQRIECELGLPKDVSELKQKVVE